MIAFKFTKTDGAEYISHLDLLRHISRILKRAGAKIKTSEGYIPHYRIFMSNPLGLGIRSVAEYCAVDCELENFKEAFNANSPTGIKCLEYYYTDTPPNFANNITECTYTAECEPFDVERVLKSESIPYKDKRGREIDIRARICTLSYSNGVLNFTLKSGRDNLRPDLFLEYLKETFGLNCENLLKVGANVKKEL